MRAEPDRYDGQPRELVAGGERDTRELFFSLALDDIRGRPPAEPGI